MLEKVKGPMIGKLRITMLIEADLKFMMRTLLNEDDKEKIEKDDRFSKSNYRSRKNTKFK